MEVVDEDFFLGGRGGVSILILKYIQYLQLVKDNRKLNQNQNYQKREEVGFGSGVLSKEETLSWSDLP